MEWLQDKWFTIIDWVDGSIWRAMFVGGCIGFLIGWML